MDTIQEIRELLKEFAIDQKALQESQKKTDAQLAKTDAQLAKTDAQLAKTDAQLAKTIKKLDAIGVQLGDLGHSNGEHAEAFFYDSLANKKTMGGVKFEVINKNYKRRRNRTEDEYDIFLENGTSIGVIEVKYKVQKAHIEKLINHKKINFRILFPEFKNYALYIGIAGLSFESDVENYAISNGLAVLKQKGDILEVDSSQMRAF
jgi:hypothetical protein